MPEDDEKNIELSELAGQISTDILMEYGYDMIISSTAQQEPEGRPAA